MGNLETLRKDFIRYIIPSILAQWVYSLYTAVDGFFVARGVSVTALTALNLSSPFMTALFAISLLFAVGTSTIVAISLGEGKKDRANELFSQNFVFLIILSILISVLVLLNLEQIGHFLGATKQTMPYMKTYIGTIAPFTAAFIVSYSFEILLKTDGYPRKAAIIVCMGVVGNCILDFLFVMVFHGGVFGAAIATAISQLIVIGLYLSHFLSKKAHLHFVRFHFDGKVILRAVRNGFSSGITELSAGIAVYFFNRAILSMLGEDALVSYTIINYVSALYVYSMTGIAQGSQPLISFYHGKKENGAVSRLLRYGNVTALGFAVVTIFLIFAGAGILASLFIPGSMNALREYTVHTLRIYALSFLPAGITIVTSGYFASVEQAWEAILVTLARAAAVLLPVLTLMIRFFGGEGIWWTPLIAESLCLTLAAVLFFFGKRTRTAASAEERC